MSWVEAHTQDPRHGSSLSLPPEGEKPRLAEAFCVLMERSLHIGATHIQPGTSSLCRACAVPACLALVQDECTVLSDGARLPRLGVEVLSGTMPRLSLAPWFEHRWVIHYILT